MNPTKIEVKTILFDAGGVLFDTFVKGDDRIRYLLMERGYQKSSIDVAIMKAKRIKLTSLQIGMKKNNTIIGIMELLQKNLEKLN